MKNFILLLFLFFSYLSNIQAQTKGDKLYRVHFAKFKHGKADSGIALGMKLFNDALVKTGHKITVLKGVSGPYDLIVINEVESEQPFGNKDEEAFIKNMIEVAGSQNILNEMIEEYNNSVQEEEISYFKNVTINNLGSSEYYRVQNKKFKHGKTAIGTEIGMKYFDSFSKASGIQNIVLRSISGRYDILVIAPVASDKPFDFGDGDKFWKHLVQNAGSEEKLKKDLEEYHENIIREDVNYFKIVK